MNLQRWFFLPISDKLGASVIVILINLPCCERFHFRQAYSSSLAFIRGQCNFLPSTTYRSLRTQTLMVTIECSFSKELQWVFMKNAWVPTEHGCSLKLRLRKYDSDKQWSDMSVLLPVRGVSERKWGVSHAYICILQTQWGWSWSLRPLTVVCWSLRGIFPTAAPTLSTVTLKMYKEKHSNCLLF